VSGSLNGFVLDWRPLDGERRKQTHPSCGQCAAARRRPCCARWRGRVCRHPIFVPASSCIALATAALACFLVFQIKGDVRYALSPSVVQDLGDARAISVAKLESLPINRTVRLAGHADRESAVVLDTQGAWNSCSFFACWAPTTESSSGAPPTLCRPSWLPMTCSWAGSCVFPTCRIRRPFAATSRVT